MSKFSSISRLRCYTSNCLRETSKRFTASSTNKKKTSSILSHIKIAGELSKFRLSSLVVLTTGAGYACVGGPIDVSTMLSACFGTALCAASASTFNQISEIEHDKLMKRTMNRPLPSGKVSSKLASMWGISTGVAGTSLLAIGTNPVVAILGASNILLYSGIYTYSKRWTELNTWIGSLVGAIPPIMGWAAAGGSLLSPAPFALSSLLFLWQFPHFFALSWLHREDYARGGFKMVSSNDPIGLRTSRFITEYSLYLTAFPFITTFSGLTSTMFTLEATAVNSYLLYLSYNFKNDRSNSNARRIFLCSLWYLPVLLTGLVIHSKNNDEIKQDVSVLDSIRDKLKEMCFHEIIVNNEKTNNPNACLKVNGDKMVESVNKTADEIVSTAVVITSDSAAKNKSDS
eukprot:gene13143-17611_t